MGETKLAFPEKHVKKFLLFGIAILFVVLVLAGTFHDAYYSPQRPPERKKLLLSLLHSNRKDSNYVMSSQKAIIANKSVDKGTILSSGQSLKIKVITVEESRIVETWQTVDKSLGVVNNDQAILPNTQVPVLPNTNSLTQVNTKPSIVPRFDGNGLVTDRPRQVITTPIGRGHHHCPGLPRPDPSLLGDPGTIRWQPVTGDSGDIAVSGFWDRRYNASGFSFVRVVGVTGYWRDKTSQGIYCQVWDRDVTKPVVWTPSIRYLNEEHHNRRYATVVYRCAIDASVTPAMVSLMYDECKAATNLLRVTDTGFPGSPKAHDIAMCVSGPLHHNYNSDGKQLINFIEAHRALGASYFYFYNHSASEALLPYLEKYVSEGVVHLAQWVLPPGMYVTPEPPPTHTQPDVHYFGQVVALQDCLYRSIATAKFLVNIDIDELIIPYKAGSIIDLLNTQLSAFSPALDYGAYVIPSSFFPTSQPRTGPFFSDPEVIKYAIRALYHLERKSKVFPHRERSKYIVHPDRVEVLGIHFVYRFTESRWKTYNVPPEIALVHHHRDDYEETENLVADSSALKFSDKILEMVRDRHKTLTQA